MNSRSLWTWLVIALALAAAVYVQFHVRTISTGKGKRLLTGLNPSAVQSIQLKLREEREIRAERTNSTWRLTAPIDYPAQVASLENLLAFLQRLTPATYLSPAEIKHLANADQEYGFKNPAISIAIYQPDYRAQLLVGEKTAPGDQVFIQLVGDQGVYIVDAEFLKLLPKSAEDLRDTSFIRLRHLSFNHVCVTNSGKFVEFEREPNRNNWRLTRPIDARANRSLMESLLQRLDLLAISDFVSDDPKADLESFGLQPPDLELCFKQGTNLTARLRFGKSPTNDATQVFAMYGDHGPVVAVARESLASWRGSVNDYRDPHLVTLAEEVHSVEVGSMEKFSLRRGTNGQWRLPEWPADGELVTNFLQNLSGTTIVEFTKDVVTPMDLASYGLATPQRKYTLYAQPAANPGTNAPRALVDLEFGTNVQERVYVRRTDESSVYAIRNTDFQRLPAEAIELRERQVWDVSENDLSGVTIRQNGKTRQLLRKGKHEWSLAPGSQGVINELAIEESVKPLCRLFAQNWAGRGADKRQAAGISENSLQVTLDLKNGTKLQVQFGNPWGQDSAFAAVTLQNDVLVFTLAPGVYRFVSAYLALPPELL